MMEGLECSNRICMCHVSATKGKGLTHCPAHNDRTPSLNVDWDKGQVLIKCHAGCSQQEVIKALEGRGLWNSQPPRLGGIQL